MVALDTIMARHLPLAGRHQIDALLPLFSTRDVAKGQPLLQQGRVWQQALAVQSGMVRMHFTRADGREFNKNFHAEGSLILPVTERMATTPSLFGITALEDTRVAVCQAAALVALLREQGCWQGLQVALLEGLITHKFEREHDLMVMDGRRRYAHLCASRPDLVARVPLVHLASYLGLTDVSLSRLRREAQR